MLWCSCTHSCTGTVSRACSVPWGHAEEGIRNPHWAFERNAGGTTASVGWAGSYKPGSSTPYRYLARDGHWFLLCNVHLENKRFISWSSFRNISYAQNPSTFLFNAFAPLFLNWLLLPQAVSRCGLHGDNTRLRNCWALWMFLTTHPRLQFSLTCANPAVCGAVLSTGSGKKSKLKITQWVAGGGKSLSHPM